MVDEKKILLEKLRILINNRKEQLLKKLPVIHEIDDGVIIRFFTDWDNCQDNNKIRYKKVQNVDKPEEIIVFFYLPKGAHFELMKREYIGCMTCLNGALEIIVGGQKRILNAYNKMCLDDNIFEGKALENSYVVTTNSK